MNGPLADLHTGRTDGGRPLHELEEANALVVGVDVRRTWFRYHHLLADLLRLELRREAPAEIPRLHRLAAERLSAEGPCDRGDPPRAARRRLGARLRAARPPLGRARARRRGGDARRPARRASRRPRPARRRGRDDRRGRGPRRLPLGRRGCAAVRRRGRDGRDPAGAPAARGDGARGRRLLRALGLGDMDAGVGRHRPAAADDDEPPTAE